MTRKALRHSNITATAAVYSHLQPRDVAAAVLALRGAAAAAQRQPAETAAPALAAQQVIAAAIESLETGRVVEVG